MDTSFVPIIAAIITTFTAVLLFLTADWRVNISLLAIQYLAVFSLVAMHWTLTMAVSKLIAGWISGAIIGMAISSAPELQTELTRKNILPSLRLSRLFYFLSAVLIGLAIYSRFSKISEWIPQITDAHAWSALILIGMGLLKLGFSVRPFPNILGILTALSGFEILYAYLEQSPLMAGLLAAVNLGIALVGSYLLLAPKMEEKT